ncbi:MAG: hypothetical protein ACMUIA_08345 [bacterium]
MNKVDMTRKKGLSVAILGILLVCLIGLLNLLDAPEYVNCVDLGICEFLELTCNLKTSRKVEDVIESMAQIMDHYLFQRSYLVSRLGLFYYVLSRHVSPYYNRDIGNPSFEKGIQVVTDQKDTPSTAQSCLPSTTLRIIAASIMRS